MSKSLKAKVTISRVTYSDHEAVNISIEDVNSGIQFAELELSLESFGQAVTGLSYREADLTVRGLQYIGKRQVTEKRTIECPLTTYDRTKLESWLRENAQEEGWIVNTYLGSQTSVSYKEGKTFLNYSVTKYVDEVTNEQ